MRLVILLIILSPTILLAQVHVDTTYTADYLVREVLLGEGVIVHNVTYHGEEHALGYYQDANAHLGIPNGLILTSGNAFFVMGPNKNPRSGWASNAPGDTDLEKIARGTTYDAAILEFDFITASENLTFEFVFASEEYLEYVGSKFNDVFAFFIEGPAVGKVNIAYLPDGITPITVNTVNNKLNEQYYIDNSYMNTTDPFVWDVRNRKVVENKHFLKKEIIPVYDTQFDGFTKVLLAKCKVIPNEIHHIKIAIADVGDGILDSGVYLKGGSFMSSGDILMPIENTFPINASISEVKEEPNITLEADERMKTPERKELGKIEFEFDEFAVSTSAAATIRHVFNAWQQKPSAHIEILGHTDSQGSHDYNIDLSKKRSEAVAAALVELGVPKDQITVNFYGENFPLNPNTTDFGRARNRRVEFFMVY